MINLSASLIKDFLACPKKAYYRINAHGEGEQTPEQIRGSIVHAVLEKGWKNQRSAMYELRNQQKKYNFYSEQAVITKSINNFFEMFPNVFSDKDEIEKYFKLPQKGQGFAYTGMMDRIHNNVIFDWKTSARPPKSIDSDIQFILYTIAYKQIYGREPSSVVYVSLPTRTMVKYNPSKVLIDEFTNKIVPNVLKSIKEGNFPRTGLYTYNGCYKCPVKSMCYKDLDNGN